MAIIVNKTGWENNVLTPAQVREKLAVIPKEFEVILKRAEKSSKNVIYYFKRTPFGNYPMHLETTNYSTK